MVMSVVVRLRCWQWCAGKHTTHGSLRIALAGGDDPHPVGAEPSDETLPTAAGDQYIDCKDRVLVTPEFMHRHRLRQIEALQFLHFSVLILTKDQKAARLAGVAR